MPTKLKEKCHIYACNATFLLTLCHIMEKNEIYSHDTLDFVKVAVSFCSTLEQAGEAARDEFVSKMLKIIPLLYLKAQLLNCPECEGELLPAPQVSEEDYNFVLGNVKALLQDDDEYLAVTNPDDLQTEETQWKSVAEHLADVYQPVRNFLAVYQDGLEECMQDALWVLVHEFRDFWGQELADAMARLHHIETNHIEYPEEDYA